MTDSAASSSLTEWMQSRVNAIYTADSPESLQSAIDAFYASNVDATVNDEKRSKDDLGEKMEAEWKFAGNGSEVEWKDLKEETEVEGTKGQVTGTYVVTRRSKIRIRAAPMTHYTTVTFTARIDEDLSIQADSSGNDGDRRRVVHLVQTSKDEQAKINLNPRAMGQAMERGQ